MKRSLPVLAMGLVIWLLPVTPYSGQAQTSQQPARQKLTKGQFDELFEQVSNWGRWGKNDQMGTLNLIRRLLHSCGTVFRYRWHMI
jgi:hypothetical protein